MLREFFKPKLRCSEVAFAWFGLVVIISHALFTAYIKFAVNRWYTGFYDLLQSSSAQLFVNASVASGADASDSLAASRLQVWDKLAAFLKIVLPAMIVQPIGKYIRSMWSLRWRMALMRTYMDAWDSNATPIEGASQRLHEDTQRFAQGIDKYLSVVLNSACVLAVFTPILFGLGARVTPPHAVATTLGSGWLFAYACGSAALGLGIAMIAGRRLVDLEVANQRVEAELRRDLVVLETTPELVCRNNAIDGQLSAPLRLLSPASHFVRLWKAILENYRALYLNFLGLNLWLDFFDQLMIIAPYVLVAPLLFATDPQERITLGTLVQTSNAFGQVFQSLSVVSENWGGINEWRSALVRLRQFEDELLYRASGKVAEISSVSDTDSNSGTTELSPIVKGRGTCHTVRQKWQRVTE